MSENLPDRRRHGYQELYDKIESHLTEIETTLDAYIDRVETRFQKRYRGMLIAFSIIGITSAVALVGFGILLDRQGDQQDKILAQQMQLGRLSAANRNLVIDIQAQRKASIRSSCRDTNHRNEKTSQRLKDAAEEAAQKAPDAATKERIRQSVGTSLGLIDSLAPKADCDKKVEEAVKPIDPVPTDPSKAP